MFNKFKTNHVSWFTQSTLAFLSRRLHISRMGQASSPRHLVDPFSTSWFKTMSPQTKKWPAGIVWACFEIVRYMSDLWKLCCWENKYHQISTNQQMIQLMILNLNVTNCWYPKSVTLEQRNLLQRLRLPAVQNQIVHVWGSHLLRPTASALKFVLLK